MSKHGKKILVVGDPHARPECDNRRFTALANFIVDKQPDEVVIIGDMADMGSLSHYDKGTVRAEGKRYSDDVAATRDAVARLMTPINAEVQRRVSSHKKRWAPKMHITLGNHEARISRAANESPALYGHLSIADLGYHAAGWNVVPFLEPLMIDNICFQHYFTSGLMGRPISGDNHAATLVKKNFMSSVAGHSHLRDYWETADAVGRKRFGLVVGCFDEGDHEYAHGTQHKWWSGLTMLHEVNNGTAEPAFFSTGYVLDKYL